MIYLAHRGFWTDTAQRNSRDALCSAFERGFGVETDVRDLNGQLVISHDMAAEPALAFSTMLADYDAAGRPGCLALNIKADGLVNALLAELDRFEGMRRSAFVFDMSVPDSLHYLGQNDLRVFTRHSEYEPFPPFETRAQGVWMDCFVNQWVNPADIIGRLLQGQQVAIVSPELHKRTVHRIFWELLRDAIAEGKIPPALVHTNLMLCTDFPLEAEEFFSKGPQ